MQSAITTNESTGVFCHLPPLSAPGGGVPLVALARARYLRTRTLEVLWQQEPKAEDRARLLALASDHQEAHWWGQNPTTEHTIAQVRQCLAEERRAT
jgi:hypothetical protein